MSRPRAQLSQTPRSRSKSPITTHLVIVGVMSEEIDHPQIRYVVPPTRLDGTPTGQAPRMRHDPDCGHFVWEDGERLGEPVSATDEQMRTLPACKSCIQRRGESQRQWLHPRGAYGGPCPTCGLTLPLTGICDNCD